MFYPQSLQEIEILNENKLSILNQNELEIQNYTEKSNFKEFDVIYETYSFNSKYQTASSHFFHEKTNPSSAMILSKRKIINIPNIYEINKTLAKDLKILYLNLNKIEKIQNIELLKNLEELHLQYNKIIKIDNLNLEKLIKIDLSNNLIESIEGIGQMKSLKWISLENNFINNLNITELITLLNLNEIHFSGNYISNLKDCLQLRKLSKLQLLDFSSNPICKNVNDFRLYMIYYINKLSYFNKIYIDQSELNKAKEFFDGKVTSELLESKLGIDDISNLTELNLTNCKLKDINTANESFFNYTNAVKLKKLDLSRNLLTSFKIFGFMPCLTELYLNSNLFEKLIGKKEKVINQKGILGLINLETLEICDNTIKDLYGIQNFKNLKNLVLRQNSINKIDNLDGLLNLIFLDVSINKLRNIEKSNIGNLPSLRSFICDSNFLKNINAFSKLPNLIYISFDNNKIGEIQSIERLANVENLREINLNNNAITKTYSYRISLIKIFANIQKIDGIEVTKEEREIAIMENQINSEEQLTDVFSINISDRNYNPSKFYSNNSLKQVNFNPKNLSEKYSSAVKVKYVNLDLLSGLHSFQPNSILNAIPQNKNQKSYESELKRTISPRNHDININLPSIVQTTKNKKQNNASKPNLNFINYVNSNDNSNLKNLRSNYKLKLNGMNSINVLKQIGEAISSGASYNYDGLMHKRQNSIIRNQSADIRQMNSYRPNSLNKK